MIGLVGSTARSQSAGPRFVKEVEFVHDLVTVTGVRELSDRTMLVGDRSEKTVFLVARADRQGRAILVRGGGPGEVMSLSEMVAASADSTLIYDSAQQRVLVLAGSRVARTFLQMDAPWKNEFDFPMAVDNAGNSYGLRAKASAIRKGPINPGKLSVYAADSAEMVMLTKGSTAGRVLFTIRGAFTASNMKVKTIAGMTSYYHLTALLDRPDLAAVCADGSVLHADTRAGRVSWWRSGQRIATANYPFARPPVTQALKRLAIIESQGAKNAVFFSPEEYPPWPARMPAFDKNGAWCLPSSDAILEGNVDATGVRPMYFVSKTGTVSPIRGVPPRTKVVGVGASGVYLAMDSEDGLVTIARYQLAER
jgi:hypothetical protein